MEEQNNNSGLEKIPMSVIGFEDDDLTPVETKEGVKNLLDLRRVKLKRGAEFCSVEDVKLGINIACQSFRKPVEQVAGLALELFKKIKHERKKQ